MQKLNDKQGQSLLQLARSSIGEYVSRHCRWQVSAVGADPRLLEPQACFVTLYLQGGLRGCIGSLVPSEPLQDNVVHNAWSAAFADPRFSPLTAQEFPEIHIDVSVLGLPTALAIDGEASLIETLRPGIDGLILHTPQGGRATFLPSVWEQLPDPVDFVQHLKRKAGLPPDYWHPAISAERYEVQCFKEGFEETLPQ